MANVLGVTLGEPMGDELHEALAEARRDHRTAADPATGATVVLRYDDCEQLAHDRRIDGVGLRLFDLLGVGDGPLRNWYGGLMFTTEGDHHDRLRRLVARAFTPRAVEELRVDTARAAADALAQVRADGGGDLGAALGTLPMQAMCRLLGVPPQDVAEFAAWADTLSVVFGVMTPEQIAAAEVAIDDLLAYVDRLVERRRRDPGPDLITALLAAEADGGRLTHDEVVAMVANLLVGGHDTTRGQLYNTLHTLVRHPGELDRLVADRTLLASAVNETMRFEPSLGFVPRTLAESVVLDVEIPAGEPPAAVQRVGQPRRDALGPRRHVRRDALRGAGRAPRADLRRRCAPLPRRRARAADGGGGCRRGARPRPGARGGGPGRGAVADRAGPLARARGGRARLTRCRVRGTTPRR
jgi:cytochrome P450